LRLIDGGARLVADDQVELRRAGERVLVSAPAEIAGLIEVRGVGIIRLEPVAEAEATLAFLVDLVRLAEVDRFPEIRCEDVLGVKLPSIALSPFEASAAAKLRFALRAFSADSVPAIIRR
jgi:serine kinase of HPr protein (carbohydrate metabolism regulator)